jgi:glutaredoxin
MSYLSQKGVSFTAKDVASDSQAFEEFAELQSPGTPTIVVDGKVIIGFDRAVLDAALAS